MNTAPTSSSWPARAVQRALPALRWVSACGLSLAVGGPALAAGPVVATQVLASAQAGRSFELEGQVQAQRQATVAAQLSGNVTALLVKAGDAVQAGQVLVRLDARDSSAGLARADAAVAEANAQLGQARLAWTRQRELRAQGFVSQAALDAADSQLQAAQAAQRQAEAGRSQAALAQGNASVTAPFAGVVLATLAEVGDLASPGRPLLTLYAPGALRAVVQVPSSRQADARAASQVRIQRPQGFESPGAEAAWLTPLRRSELPGTDPVAQTVEWRLDLPAEAARQLSPGQSLRVRFDAPATASAAASGAATPAPLSVPAAAVLRRGELTAVYVAQGGQFVLRAVRTGAPQAGRVPLLAGVQAGERVALDAVRAGLAQATPAP